MGEGSEGASSAFLAGGREHSSVSVPQTYPPENSGRLRVSIVSADWLRGASNGKFPAASDAVAPTLSMSTGSLESGEGDRGKN